MISPRAGLAVVAVAVLFGGDLLSVLQTEHAVSTSTDDLAAGKDGVDRLSIGGKIHISFCGS
eukprot:scaffold289688_cov30-Prasinocladus_malaysianus.AAC.1